VFLLKLSRSLPGTSFVGDATAWLRSQWKNAASISVTIPECGSGWSRDIDIFCVNDSPFAVDWKSTVVDETSSGNECLHACHADKCSVARVSV
jgi:hypothetical protein